jgi:lipopolysaccharide export system protein LptA
MMNYSYALKGDKNKETKLSSDTGNFNDVDQEYVLTGNVLITKGSIVVKGSKAVVIVDPEGYQQITVRGDIKTPAFFSQQLDKPYPEFIEGFADIIFYEAKKDQLLLSGKAFTSRKKGAYIVDKLIADKINYDLYTEEYNAQSADLISPSKSVLGPKTFTDNTLKNTSQ